MSRLSDSELAQIRNDIADLLPDTCEIMTLTTAPDGYGGQTESWGTASASVPCRFDLRTGNNTLSLAGAAQQDFVRYLVTLPYNTVISTGNRIDFGDSQFKVVLVDGSKSWIGSMRVEVEKL